LSDGDAGHRAPRTPHPGAQLSLVEEADGWRYQAFVTNTRIEQLEFLEAGHRAYARVEDRLRHAKDSGLGRFPSRKFKINQAWLMLVGIAADLVAWARLLACAGDAAGLARCEPKAPRYRLLHVPARVVHGARSDGSRPSGPGPGRPRSSWSSPASPPSRNPPDQTRPPTARGTGEPQPGSASRHALMPGTAVNAPDPDQADTARASPPS
jgi:hypothetical protein